MKLHLAVIVAPVLLTLWLSGCGTVTSYDSAVQTDFPAYTGEVLLLGNERGKEEVPGAEEVGVVTVETTNPWVSNADIVKRWKREAAKHGANAVRGHGEGGNGRSHWAWAKTYRIENINDPLLKEYLAPPWSPHYRD